MEIPKWVPREKVEVFSDPKTGELIEVTYRIAAPSQQKTILDRVEEPNDGDSFGVRRKKFLNYVVLALKFNMPTNHATREKLYYTPVDGILRDLWEQQYQLRYGASYDPDEFIKKEWNSSVVKRLRYEEYCRDALMMVTQPARKKALSDGMTLKNPNSLVPFVTTYTQNNDRPWLKLAWNNWKERNPVAAEDLMKEIDAMKG